jgi:hypothetical protein
LRGKAKEKKEPLYKDQNYEWVEIEHQMRKAQAKQNSYKLITIEPSFLRSFS